MNRCLLRTTTFIALLLFAIKATAQTPTITSFSPVSGPVGSTITIHGSNFSSTPTANTVYFGGVKAAVQTASPTTLTVLAPAGATPLPIAITVNNLTAYSRNPSTPTFPEA